MTAATKKAWVGTVGSLFGPFVFFSLWLLPTECGVRFGLEGLCYPFLFLSVMVGLGFMSYLPIPLVAKFCVTPFYAFFMACALFTFWYYVGESVFDLQMSELPPNKSLEPTAAPLLGLARLPFRAAGSSGCGSALSVRRCYAHTENIHAVNNHQIRRTK